MSAGLKLAPDLVLPVSFATEGVAAIGMRGSGKSNTLARWAEVLYKAKIPFVVTDPKGDWSGLRSSRDGKKAGLEVALFGGPDGDLPLTEHLGARIADMLVDTGLSAVLDVSRRSGLSIGGRVRFLTEFFHQLMERHTHDPHVRCVILEEAHRYIPQNVTASIAACKEAAASILLEGRAFGLGCWAATQRPARLHKDVLEEVGTAIIHRIGAAATNDLKTVAGWVKHEDLGPEIVPSLTKLADGEAWVLAPQTLGVAKRVQIDRRQTYDSAATPLVGAGSRPVLTLAQVDTAALKEALEDAIEEAKANDPSELRRQLEAANARIAEFEMWEPPPPPAPVIGLSDEVAQHLAQVRDQTLKQATSLVDAMRELCDVVDEAIAEAIPSPPAVAPPVERASKPAPVAVARSVPPVPGAPPAGVPSGAMKILATAAKVHPLRLTWSQLATQSGYSTKSSTWEGHTATLRRVGLMRTENKQAVVTPEGLAVADVTSSTPSTPAEVLEFWTSKLKAGPASMLRALVNAGANGLSLQALCDVTGYSITSSTTEGHVATLKRNGLVEGGTAKLVASEMLRR